MAEPDNNQMAFWEAMKEKYERRNESLKQQEVCLRKRLEQLKQIMENQKAGDDCDCVPEKLEKPSLVQCLVEKGRSLILGSCKCGDPKVGEELLCACHIQESESLNIDNLCPMQEPSPPDGCLNPTCDFYDPTLAHLAENPSIFSLKTTDIYYMDKLADLVKTEKNMQDKIDDLEKREYSYLTNIHDMQEAMKKQTRCDPINREFKKITESLQEENKKLRNEIEDIQLELKHCFERVEGPLRRSLENQQEKSSKLEKQLEDLQVKSKFKEDSYLREINEVKAKLCQTCCTMVDLNNVNSKLKDDLASLQRNCMSLEDELLKQKLKEAENILKFKNALSRRNPKRRIQDKGDDTEQDLGHIAKKLGDTLKEVCPCVTDVPSGLTETAENIRQLTELVVEKGAQQRKKRTRKIPQVTSSCSCETDIRESGTSPKPQTKIEAADECACSNSSLRLKPKIGKQQTQIGGSSSFSLETKPKLSMKATKQTPKTETVAKKTVSKGCTCCPAQNECSQLNISKESTETLCSCSDVDTKKTGPSEEVIAVKNLGTLSMPTEKTPIQAVSSEMTKIKDEHDSKIRRTKLAVDTTCDILDETPKDIHVVTTLANTGSLEITTEGPPGIIETRVNYLNDGKIEIVTKLINRRNMESFLDGTLLHIPEDAPHYDKSRTRSDQPDEKKKSSEDGCPEMDCNQSKTCEGQCDNEAEVAEETDINQQNLVNMAEMAMDEKVDNSQFKKLKKISSEVGCPEMDCNHSETCEGQCENEAVQAAVQDTDINEQNLVNVAEMTMNEKIDNSFHCGQVMVDNFMTREWKNMQFQDDSREEAALQEMAFLETPKTKRQERAAVHTNVTTEEDIFRLSSKQSLTDVEDNIIKSSRSLVFPDMLDTISEGEEDHSESKNDDVVKGESEESTTSDNSSEECIVEAEVVGETDDRSEALILIEKEDVLEIEPWEYQPILILEDAIQTENPVKDLNLSQATIRLKSGEKSDPCLICQGELTVQTKIPSHGSLTNFTSATPFEGASENYSEWQVSESFFKLSGNFSGLNGKITLKQSKSMYEKRGSGSDYLRICKSATLSMGSLKIDLERLKYWRKIPSVGDSSTSRMDDRGRVLAETIHLGLASVDGVKRSPCLEMDENVDALKEGCSPFESYRTIPEPTYQCFICSCSNPQNKNDDQQKKTVRSSQNNQDLADRIDRLLEIDPLAECQCIDCILRNVPKDNNSCRCSLDEERLIPKLEGPKQQGDNVQHDENCTCVDCICDPCHFKKYVVAGEMNDQPLEMTVMNVSVPCDCVGKCPCSPCMDESKKSKRQKREADTTLPSTWKNVEGCLCSPLSPDEKVVCDCEPCECKPCHYGEKASKPPKKEPKTYGPSGKSDSLSDIDNDVPKEDTNYLSSSINCDCRLCECLFCSDPNARTKSAAKPLTVPGEGKQELNVLNDTSPAEQMHLADGYKCNCDQCECDPCLDTNYLARKTPEVVRDDTTEEKQTLKSPNSLDAKNRGDNSDEKTIEQINHSDEKHKCPCSMNPNTNEPVECDDCLICCGTVISDKPTDWEVEDACTITCDADRAKEEIKCVLNKIGCSCDQAEDNLKPLVKQASNFETTISRMKMKLNNLQQKCKDKDQIINAMTDELRMRSQSGVFEDLLHDLAHPKEKFTPDFTRAHVCDLLPKPRHKIKPQPKRGPSYRFNNTLEPILEVDRYLSGNEHDTCGCTKNLDVSRMEIIDIRRVTIDSILIKWRGPTCLNGVTGYQIFVNDELKYRVLSPNRTSAVIDSLDLGSSLEIMLFAITFYGRCEPPALATYKI